MTNQDGGEPMELNIEPLGGTKQDTNKSLIKTTEKDSRSTQLSDHRVTNRSGLGKRPPYDPDLLAQYIEKNETHSVAVRKKARYEVGYGFDLAPIGELEPEDASDDEREILEAFWFSRDSLWQTGPRRRAEPTVPEEVLELARQDYHAIGWAALEILTDEMGRPVGLAHVPANTLRIRTPQANYQGTRHPENGEFRDPRLGEHASRGYVQIRHGQRRYFGEAGDRYRGQEVVHTPAEDDSPGVRYIPDEGSDEEPIFVDRETGDVALGDASELDNQPANELIFVRNPSVLADDYGIPDWVSAIRTITGDEAAKDYNRQFFQNDTIPRFVIKVTGGTISEESKKDLRKMLTNLREEDHRTVVLEVDKFTDNLDDDVEIELEPLGQGVQEEMSFGAYREKNEHAIAQVHEVPPVLIGVTESANRSNSEAQVHEFATEVIKPEQNKFSERLYRVLHQTAFACGDWQLEFRLRGANQPREDARTASEKISAVNGAVPVNRALRMIGEDPINEEDVDFDPNSTLVANVGSIPNGDDSGNGNSGGVEASEDRHDHAPPVGNKVGEREWSEVKARLEKDPIESMSFNSSNLDEGLYDFEEQECFISFERDEGGSSLYAYVDVPTSVWQSLANAGSHGSYHYENIRMEYGYVEISNFHDRLPEGPVPDSVPDGVPAGI